MSNMIPQESADAFRIFTNVSVENYGMPCTLYVPNNLTATMLRDTYTKPSDYVFDEYDTKVWIEWAPNKRQLAKLGLFAEEETPMLAHFSNVFRGPFQDLHDLDITIGSYFEIGVQYITKLKEYVSEFDIVDVMATGMANKLMTKVFKIAPRRVKPVVAP